MNRSAVLSFLVLLSLSLTSDAADGFIVASSLERDGRAGEPVEAGRVRELLVHPHEPVAVVPEAPMLCVVQCVTMPSAVWM